VNQQGGMAELSVNLDNKHYVKKVSLKFQSKRKKLVSPLRICYQVLIVRIEARQEISVYIAPVLPLQNCYLWIKKR